MYDPLPEAVPALPRQLTEEEDIMFELKPISSAGVPRAIAKAERYRLLNEPEEAESICLDILRVDADNQEVLVMLLLAITDQFGKNPDVGAGHANRVLAKLRGELRAGLLCRGDRREVGKGQLAAGSAPQPRLRLLLEAGGEAGVRSPPQLPLSPPLGDHPA